MKEIPFNKYVLSLEFKDICVENSSDEVRRSMNPEFLKKEIEEITFEEYKKLPVWAKEF